MIFLDAGFVTTIITLKQFTTCHVLTPHMPFATTLSPGFLQKKILG